MSDPSFSARRGAARMIVMALGLSVLAGCGNMWFGEEEIPLPGERISLRSAGQERPVDGAKARFTKPRPVTSWPQAGGSATRALGHIDGVLTLEKAWSASVGAGSDSESRVTAPPVAAGGKVFALDAAAQVTAVSLEDGDEIWSADLTPEDEDSRDGFGGGLAVQGDVVVAVTGFGQAHGLNAKTGEKLWTFETGSPIRSAPAVSRNLAVIVTRDGQLMALNITNGQPEWRIAGLEAGASMLGGSPAAISPRLGAVVAPFSTGEVGIFELRSGRRGWLQPLGSARRGAALSLISDVSSPPVISGDAVFAGGVAGRLVAFEMSNKGRRIWGRDLALYNRIWAGGETIFAISEDARVYALNARNGSTIWRTDLPRYDDPDNRADPFAYGGPILIGGKLYITSSDGVIFEINAVTGGKLREVSFPNGGSISPIFAGGYLLILDENANLHAYR